MTHRPLSLCGICAFLVLVTSLGGCGDLKLGNSDSRQFNIDPVADLAVGAWLQYQVTDEDHPTRRDIGFVITSVAPDGLIDVRDSNTFGDVVVDGIADGSAHVAFRAVADGAPLDDGFGIDVATVVSLELADCASGGVYLRGTDAPVPYTFRGASRYRTLLGLGLYPVEVVPPASVTLRPELSDAYRWIFSIGVAAPAEVVLDSTLPGDPAQHTMTIIDASAIDGVSALTASSRGTTRIIDVMPRAGGRPVCGRFRRVVRSSTPNICALRSPLQGGNLASLETLEASVTVALLAAGVCQLTLELPDLGISIPWPAWTVASGSSGGGGSDWDDWD